MPRVPNAEQAIIDPRKFTEYLLDQSSEQGSPKAKFLEGFGFTMERQKALRRALVLHLRTYEFAETHEREHGQVFEVVGPLSTPDGRNPYVKVVWIVRSGEERPRLVTLVPARGAKS